MWGIHRGPVNSPHKWPVTRKMSPFDDVTIIFSVSETRDSTSEQLMTMFSAVALFCSIPVILICHDTLLESTYCFFFHLVNNKLHCGFHHCRACFSFSGGFHISGQIWVEVSQRASNHLYVRDLWLAVYSWNLCKPDIVPVSFSVE